MPQQTPDFSSFLLPPHPAPHYLPGRRNPLGNSPQTSHAGTTAPRGPASLGAELSARASPQRGFWEQGFGSRVLGAALLAPRQRHHQVPPKSIPLGGCLLLCNRVKKKKKTDIASASFVSINTDIQWLARRGTVGVLCGDVHGSACCTAARPQRCGVGTPAASREGSRQPHWESNTPPACRAKMTKPLHFQSFLGSEQQWYQAQGRSLREDHDCFQDAPRERERCCPCRSLSQLRASPCPLQPQNTSA